MVWITEKHPRFIRWCHWINVPILLLMIWSGTLIYWAHQAYLPIPKVMADKLLIEFRLAEGMGWHFLLMWFYSINGLVYIVYLFISGEWREFKMNKKTIRLVVPYLLYDLKISKKCQNYEGKYNPVQKLAYLVALLFGSGSLISGLAIFRPVQLGVLTKLLGGYEAARLFHFSCMFGLVFFIFIHIIQVFRSGWNNLRSMIAGYEIEKK